MDRKRCLSGVLFILLFVVGIGTVLVGSNLKSEESYRRGWNDAVNQIPSCLYVDRPSANKVKPWGFDNKEGVDIRGDLIVGGGVFVSLDKWKQRK